MCHGQMIPMAGIAVVETRCALCGGRIPKGSRIVRLRTMNGGDARFVIICSTCNVNDAKEILGQ